MSALDKADRHCLSQVPCKPHLTVGAKPRLADKVVSSWLSPSLPLNHPVQTEVQNDLGNLQAGLTATVPIEMLQFNSSGECGGSEETRCHWGRADGES